MFIGFSLLLFLLLLVGVTIAIVVFGSKKSPKLSFYLIVAIWGGCFLLGLSSYFGRVIWSKKILDKEDFYGTYIIDRNYFKGKQADWQYNHFRFEIKENDSIYFYETNENEIVKTYKGIVFTVTPYQSARLQIKMEQPTHHILNSNPTIYREVWDFYMVFNSPKFYNMYFRKGEWEHIK